MKKLAAVVCALVLLFSASVSMADASEKVNEMLKLHFRPEFLNRLDEIIMFKPLTRENISDIIDLLMADMNKRVKDREISIRLTEEAKDLIGSSGYDPVYGARPLKRYLQKNVETLVAKLILENKLMPGDCAVLDTENGELVCHK